MTFSILSIKAVAAFFWDPNPIFFHLPLVHHPIAWYGMVFALGLGLCYLLLQRRACEINLKRSDVEQMTTWSIIGIVVGARLAHVLFYDLPLYLSHPLDIFKIWEGGLASHGGVVGVLLALALFAKRHHIKPQALIDAVAPLGLLLGAFIRLGNFVNQEILGTASSLPWAVVFGHPIDGSLPLPRHPVQLYEAALYGALFIISWSLWKKAQKEVGFTLGFVLASSFSGRIVFELFKEPMSRVFEGSLHMGSWLSIPIVLLGLVLMSRRWVGGRLNS